MRQNKMDESNIRMLFAAIPSWKDLLSWTSGKDAEPRLRVNVWRNHAIEHVELLMRPFLFHNDMAICLRKGGFDDTLSISDWQPGDVEILWVDLDRYSGVSDADLLSLLDLRVKTLRELTSVPILLLTCSSKVRPIHWSAALKENAGLLMMDLSGVANEHGIDLFDDRLAGIAGGRLSRNAQVMIARHLACQWIPAALRFRVKAIVVDLDNTLHQGVLGEDGNHGVKLTDPHRALQQRLKTLSESGVFIALASKNRVEDVEELFRKRSDYPLQLADFSVVEASWNSKDQAIMAISQSLNIGVDSILFVDDNPGELIHVCGLLHEISALRAIDDASFTTSQIDYHPGVWQWAVGVDDSLRVADVRMKEFRLCAMREAGIASGPLPGFNTVISVAYDRMADQRRVAEMCGKTNQFNLSLKRYGEAEVSSFLNAPEYTVISVRLCDRFSDSGLIGVIVIHKQDEDVVVKEVCLSCRSLGRGLEDALIIPAIVEATGFRGCRNVVFEVSVGARNEPAIKWLEKIRGPSIESTECDRKVELAATLFLDRDQRFSGVTYIFD